MSIEQSASAARAIEARHQIGERASTAAAYRCDPKNYRRHPAHRRFIFVPKSAVKQRFYQRRQRDFSQRYDHHPEQRQTKYEPVGRNLGQQAPIQFGAGHLSHGRNNSKVAPEKKTARHLRGPYFKAYCAETNTEGSAAGYALNVGKPVNTP
jgi:hypothetical protein